MTLYNRLLSNKHIHSLMLIALFFVFAQNTFATNYYFAASGTLTSTASWGTNTDGTGSNPSNFTAASQVFYIQNNSSVTLSGSWTVSGSGSKVVLGDGTNAITLTMNSTLTGTIDVSNNATLSIAVTTIPTLGTIGATNTTVDYSASGNQTITAKTYHNLTTSGSGTKTLAGTTVINGLLTLNAALSAVAKNLTFTNDIAGTKTLLAVSTATTLIINGTTAVTLPSNMSGIGPLTINNSGGVSMDANLKLSNSALTLTSGDFNIGSHELEFSSTSASIAGTATNLKSTQYSSIRFTSTNSGLTIPSSVSDLKCLYVGSPNTLANNINIHDTLYLHLSGTFNNGSYLTMKTGATIQKATNTALLQTEPNAQSSYNVKYIGSVGYLSGTELPAGSTKLNNLIIEKGATYHMQLDKDVTVNGDVIINTGILHLNGHALKIKKNFRNNGANTSFVTSTGSIEFAGTDTIFVTDENTFGNILITGTLIAPSNYPIKIAGTFINNGTFNNRSATVKITSTFSSIGGTSVTTFHHIETLIGAYFPGTLSKNFKIDGNFKMYYNTGLTTSDNSMTFTGDSLQTISSTSNDVLNLNFLVNIDKTSGKVQLNTPVNIIDTIEFNGGKITTDTVNILSFKAGSVCIKNDDSSYVQGPAIKIGNTAFDFPLQKPLSISASAVVTDSWRAQYFGTNQTQGATLAGTLTNLNNCEHWKMTRKAGSSFVQVTLNWDTYSCRINSNKDRMRVTQYTGGTWVNLGNDGTTGDTIKGSVVSFTSSQGGYYTLAQNTSDFTNYYLASGGTITSTSSWGVNTDGSGTNPTNFTTADQIFNVVNNSSLTLSSAWTVSGLSSRIVVGDGTNAIAFTQSATISTAPIDVKSNATLNINHSTNPVLNKLNTNSTVNYNKTAAQTIVSAIYGNLTTGGSGNKGLGGEVTVNGTLTLGAPLVIGNTYLLTFTNDIAGTKTNLVATSLSALKINGTSAVTLPSNFTDIGELEINNTGGVTMATSLTPYTFLKLRAGDFNIGANTLTCGTNFTLQGTPTNLKSTSASSIAVKTNYALAIPTSITSLLDLDVTMNAVTTTTLSASLNIYGNLTVGKGSIVNSSYINMQPNTNVIVKTGTLTGELNAAGMYNLSYETTGAGNTTTGIELPTTTTLLKNLTINSNNSGRRITIDKNVKINGNITITQGILNLSTYTVSLKGNFTNSVTNAGFEAATSTVNFVGNTTITTTDENEFNNVTITDTLISCAAHAVKVKGNLANNGLFTHNSGTIKFSGTSTISGSSTTQFNNLTINSGATLTHGTSLAEIKIAGNFSNSGTFTHSNKKLTFNGTTAQSFYSSVAITIYDLQLNKSSNSLSLTSPLDIAGTATFTLGKMITDTVNIITFNNGAAVSGASDNSFVSGPVKKVGNATFVFPTGKSNNYQPISITAPSNVAAVYTAEYFNSGQSLGSGKDATLDSISTCEYWTLNNVGTVYPVSVTLGWDNSSCRIATQPMMRLTRWNGSLWSDLGNSTSTAGIVTSTSTVSTFGYFTLAQELAGRSCNSAYNIPITDSLTVVPSSYNLPVLSNYFKFIATDTIIDLALQKVDNTFNIFNGVSFYSGSCASLTHLFDSVKTIGDTAVYRLRFSNLTIGNPYFITVNKCATCADSTLRLIAVLTTLREDFPSCVSTTPDACDMVKNGSFNSTSACPNNQNQIDYACNWGGLCLVPQLYTSCATGALLNGINVNYTTNNSVGFMAGAWNDQTSRREYLKQALLLSLVAGKKYFISYDIAHEQTGIYAIKNGIGLYLTATNIVNSVSPTNFVIRDNNVPIVPQIPFNETTFAATNFQHVCGVYTGTGTERYLYFGNFNMSGLANLNIVTATTSPTPTSDLIYYYVDNISIKPIVLTLTSTAHTPCLKQLNAALTGCAASGQTISYLWSPSTGLSSTTVANPTVTNTGGSPVTTTYTCTISVGTTPCVIEENIAVTVDPTPTATISGGGSICSTGSSNVSVALTGTSPWTIVYNDGTSNITVTGITSSPYVFSANAPASYTLVSMTDAYCTGTVSGSASVTNSSCTCGATLASNTWNSGYTLAAGTYYSVNNITVNTSVTLTNVILTMAPGKTITVSGSASLTLNHCHLYACTDMWQGIVVNAGGTLIVNNGSLIEEAILAVDVSSPNTSTILTVNDAIFNKNLDAIGIDNYQATSGYGNFDINKAVFTCRSLPYTSTWPTVATLQTLTSSTLLSAHYTMGSYSTATLKAPNSGDPANSGVKLTDVGTNSGGTFHEALIDGNNGSGTINLFDNMLFGITADNSNFTCNNNAFQYIIEDGANTGIAINATDAGAGYNTDNRIQVTGTANDFYDCSTGIYIDKYNDIEITGADMRSTQMPSGSLPAEGEVGIYVKTPNCTDITIDENIITNIRTGIVFYADAAAATISGTPFTDAQSIGPVQITDNTIRANYSGVTLTNEYSNVAIIADNLITYSGSYYPSWVAGYPPNIDVAGNHIHDVHNGISMNNWRVWIYTSTLGYGARAVVHDNYVKMREVIYPSTTNIAQTGISLATNINCLIEKNNIVGFGNSFDDWAGIYSENVSLPDASYLGEITCNKTTNTGTGVWFYGDNGSMYFANNTMDNSGKGLVLDNSGIIGDQGDATTSNDNVWVNFGTAGTYLKTYTRNTTTPNTHSPLYIQQGTSSFDPDNGTPAYNGTNGSTSDKYLFANNSLISATNPNGVSCGTLISGRQSNPGSGIYTDADEKTNRHWLEQVLTDSSRYLIFPEQQIINAQHKAYRLLNLQPSLKDSSAILQMFYVTAKNGNIGKLAGIENELAAAQLSNAMAHLNSFAPENTIESNYKSYYSAYLHFKQNAFTTSDSSLLKQLVLGCSARDGAMVQQARSLYSLIYSDFRLYRDHCVDTVISFNRGAAPATIKKTVVTQQQFVVYPNPTKGEIWIQLDGVNDNSKVTIYDIAGKVVFEKNLSIENIVKINPDLNSGTYLISIKPNNTAVKPFNGRITVIK